MTRRNYVDGMTFRARFLRVPAALATAALLATACGGSTDSTAESTLAPLDTPVPTEVPVETGAPVDTEVPAATDPTTTLAPTTTAAPETTVAPATTAATPAPPPAPPAPAAMTLRTDGIGPLAFGATTPDQLIAAMTPVIGSPSSVASLDYAVDAGGFFENVTEERGFAFVSGRDVCFGNGLCTYFGGGYGAALTFVGYRQNEGVGALTTASGVTAGSRGAVVGATIVAEPGGCFSTGSGTADGVRLFLQSSGEPFGYFDGVTEEYVSQVPAIGDISVISVSAGEEPFYTYEDC